MRLRFSKSVQVQSTEKELYDVKFNEVNENIIAQLVCLLWIQGSLPDSISTASELGLNTRTPQLGPGGRCAPRERKVYGTNIIMLII
jgi:hypothetical protein